MLPMIPVNLNVEDGQPAINDDTYLPLKCEWYKNLVRIATIGDGSCFIHAILKGCCRQYQENESAVFRLNIVREFRRNLAKLLNAENPRYPGHTFWETTKEGDLLSLLMTYILNQDLMEEDQVDYSLAGMQRLLNSSSFLGEEVFEFISDVLNIDIYTFRATQDDLFYVRNTHRYKENRHAVIVIGNDFHWELVALNTDSGIETIFSFEHPLIQKIISHHKLKWEKSTFDPDEEFIKSIMSVFITRVRIGPDEDDLRLDFCLPRKIKEIFSISDPFVRYLIRLYPRIIEKVTQMGARILPTSSKFDPLSLSLDILRRNLKKEGYSNTDIDTIIKWIQSRIDPNHPKLPLILPYLEQDQIDTKKLVKFFQDLL